MKPLKLSSVKCTFCFFFLLVGLLGAFLTGGKAYASCIDLSDVPLDTMQEEAPGIVMFCIDDSGSMDWSMVCPPPEPKGVFNENYYIFSNPGDDIYTGYYYGENLEDYDSEKMKWQSQWSGYNRMYYDPESYYRPWPGLPDADPDNPRSNPVINDNELNMNAMWWQWEGGGGAITTQEILDAGGEIVDNSDTAVAGDEEIELIIDSSYGGDGTFSRSGPWGRSSSYYNAWEYYYYYTNSTGQVQATWTFNNLVADDYDVYVWYVDSSNRANDVTYTVYDNEGAQQATRNFDQRSNGGEWRLLASDVTLTAGNASVVLDHDVTSTSNDRACADAVRLVRVEEAGGTPDILFEADIPPWDTSSSGEEYGDDYLWTPTDGITYTATWTANILDQTVTYDVYARWAGGSGTRSDSVTYTVTHDEGTTTQSVNQNYNRGEWQPIAQGVTFSGGTGIVELEHYRDHNYDRACADAVAFVPTQAGGDVSDIARRHYYVRNNNGTFLVNLINNGIEYYKVNLDNPDDTGEVVTETKLDPLTETEADNAGIVTNRTFDEEAQNFANWYSFYRRRELTAKNAIANVIDTMNGVYIGIISINGNLLQRALPVRVNLDGTMHDESQALLDALYAYNSSGSTYLRNALNNVGRYYSGDYLKPGSFDAERSSETYPYFITEKGGSCQQSFAIAMTDGYWNGSSPGLGDTDGDGNYTTLADVAMYYYDNDLNTNLNDDVPITTRDPNNRQHMVTYGVSFGVSGSLDPEQYADCPIGTCPDTWPNPFDSDSAKIDDLFHASVNGRGAYVNADSPTELSEALQKLQQDIESRLGSAAAVATNSVQRQVGTVIYQGTYDTAGWIGEIKAMKIDVGSGAIDDTIWLASEHVTEWGSRNILSYNGTSGIVFDGNNITTAQANLLEANGLGAEADQIVDYIKGDTSNDLSQGGPFRVRTKPIGDIVHSAPTYYKGSVYVGANDGMLHAVDAVSGEEKFCYVPNLVYDHLSNLANPSYSHKYYVDGTADASKVGSQELLVCGLGKGGKGYFCLDITTPDTMEASDVLWEYPASGTDPDLGYSYSQAEIANTKAGQVVIFGNGYDSANEEAILYVLSNITSGSPAVSKIHTGAANCNGLSTPALVDVDIDGYVDFVYAGDLHGNMWKFDLRSATIGDWKVYYEDGGTSMPLVSVQNSNGTAQPITKRPEVMLDCAKSDFADGGNGLMVIFGTGKYMNVDDLEDTTVQSYYGVWDWGDIWESEEDYDIAKTQYLGELGTDRTLGNVSGTTLQEQTVASQTNDWVILSDNPVDWYNPDENTGSDMGWFFDLPTPGERGIREPMLRKGVAILISTIPSDSPCEAGGSSVMYQVNACTGGRTFEPQFDVTGEGDIDEEDLNFDASEVFDSSKDYNDDGVVNEEDVKYFLNNTDYNGDGEVDESDLDSAKLPPTGKKFGKILFEGAEIGDMLYPPDSEGGINPTPVPPNPQGMMYWRMIQ